MEPGIGRAMGVRPDDVDAEEPVDSETEDSADGVRDVRADVQDRREDVDCGQVNHRAQERTQVELHEPGNDPPIAPAVAKGPVLVDAKFEHDGALHGDERGDEEPRVGIGEDQKVYFRVLVWEERGDIVKEEQRALVDGVGQRPNEDELEKRDRQSEAPRSVDQALSVCGVSFGCMRV
jgi:hypothetical protein